MKKFEQIINSYITEEQTLGKGNDIPAALENLKSAINAAANIPFKKKGEILGGLEKIFQQLGGQVSSQPSTSSTGETQPLGSFTSTPQSGGGFTSTLQSAPGITNQ